MAVTLAESKKNTTDDLDLAVIDEFVKNDWFISNVQFDDAVNPAGGGGTLTYGYTRLVTERAAAVRDYGAEAPVGAAVRDRFSVDLVPLAGKYTIDRDLAKLGPAASNEVAFQSTQAIKSVRALFNDSMINGARQSNDNGFDGLDAALAGSSTEVTESLDISAATIADDRGAANDALDTLETLLSMLDGEATALLTNRLGVLRLRSLARRAGYYERTKDDFGRTVESFAGVPFVDLGAQSGSNSPVIPVSPIAGTTPGQSTDIYAVRLGLDGLHAVTTNGGQVISSYLPDFSTAGAVKDGEVTMGPVALALKKTKAAAVIRDVVLTPAVA